MQSPSTRSIRPCAGRKLGFAPGAADKLRRVRALYRTLRDNHIQLLVGFVMSGDRTVWAAAKLAGVKLVAAERNAPQMYGFRYGSRGTLADVPFARPGRPHHDPDGGLCVGVPGCAAIAAGGHPEPGARGSVTAAPDQADAAGRWTLLAVSRLDPTRSVWAA